MFSPKDKIGDWLEMYVRVMELNYWGSSQCLTASYDEDTREWTVNVERRRDDGTTEQVVLKPKQLVLATGMSGVPNVPQIPGADTVRGRDPPLQPAPRQLGVRREAVHRGRVEQLGPRHLRRPVGARRRCHHDPAVLDPHRPVRHADGVGARRPLLRAGARQRRHDRDGRPDLRVDPVPHHAHIPDPGLRGDGARRRRVLPAPGEGRLHARLGRRRFGPVHEVPPSGVGLLHRCRRVGARRQRQCQAAQRGQHRRDPTDTRSC